MTTSDREVADAVGDAIRERVHPMAGEHAGYGVVMALSLRGFRIIRGDRTTVNASWLANVLAQVDTGPDREGTAGQKAAAYDRLVAAINQNGRGTL